MSIKLIDDIFGEPEIKHGLNVFSSVELQNLNLLNKVNIYCREKDNAIVVKCLKRNREIIAKPEEIVRQLFLVYIRDYLSYSLSQVDVEVPIQMGADDSKRADIVVFTDDTCTRKYLLFEIKKPNAETGVDQLQSYLNATGTFFGAWSNGKDIVFQLREESPETKGEPYNYRDIARLPKKGEALNDVLKPLTKKDLQNLSKKREI